MSTCRHKSESGTEADATVMECVKVSNCDPHAITAQVAHGHALKLLDLLADMAEKDILTDTKVPGSHLNRMHRIILASGSHLLMRKVALQGATAQTYKFDYSEAVIEMMCRYLYSGVLTIDSRIADELKAFSDEFAMRELSDVLFIYGKLQEIRFSGGDIQDAIETIFEKSFYGEVKVTNVKTLECTFLLREHRAKQMVDIFKTMYQKRLFTDLKVCSSKTPQIVYEVHTSVLYAFLQSSSFGNDVLVARERAKKQGRTYAFNRRETMLLKKIMGSALEPLLLYMYFGMLPTLTKVNVQDIYHGSRLLNFTAVTSICLKFLKIEDVSDTSSLDKTDVNNEIEYVEENEADMRAEIGDFTHDRLTDINTSGDSDGEAQTFDPYVRLLDQLFLLPGLGTSTRSVDLTYLSQLIDNTSEKDRDVEVNKSERKQLSVCYKCGARFEKFSHLRGHLERHSENSAYPALLYPAEIAASFSRIKPQKLWDQEDMDSLVDLRPSTDCLQGKGASVAYSCLMCEHCETTGFMNIEELFYHFACPIDGDPTFNQYKHSRLLKCASCDVKIRLISIDIKSHLINHHDAIPLSVLTQQELEGHLCQMCGQVFVNLRFHMTDAHGIVLD